MLCSTVGLQPGAAQPFPTERILIDQNQSGCVNRRDIDKHPQLLDLVAVGLEDRDAGDMNDPAVLPWNSTMASRIVSSGLSQRLSIVCFRPPIVDQNPPIAPAISSGPTAGGWLPKMTRADLLCIALKRRDPSHRLLKSSS